MNTQRGKERKGSIDMEGDEEDDADACDSMALHSKVLTFYKIGEDRTIKALEAIYLWKAMFLEYRINNKLQ